LDGVSHTCRHAHVWLLVIDAFTYVLYVLDMLHVLLLAVVGELVRLFVVVVVANININVVLWIGAILVILAPVHHGTLRPRIPSTITAESEALCLNRIRYVLRVV
jgi:hypothetical protein